MTIIRRWTAEVEQNFSTLSVTFECPFFDELIEPNGRLTRHFECHALWDYYGNALRAYEMAKANIVYEDELSRVFDLTTARQLFLSIAKKHGVRPQDMVNFWPHVERQRIAMGGKDHLPEEFQFRYWVL